MPEEHMPWLTNAYLYFKSCSKEMMRQASDIFELRLTEPDTRYHLTALARNTRIAQVPAIDTTIQRAPTVPIPDVTDRPEPEIIMEKIGSLGPSPTNLSSKHQ